MSMQVCVGFHSTGNCTTQFAISLAGLVRYSGTKIASLIHIPSPYVTEARNKIVRKFLQGTKASHLLMLDVDEEFPDDAMEETMAAMRENKAEIMFGCYALGDFRPSLFYAPGKPDGHLPTVAPNLEAGKDYKVYAGSTGWLLATREALTQIWEANKDKHWPWFDHDVEFADDLQADLRIGNTLRIGEDFTFSKRARECGIQLWGTTRPLIVHDKYQPLLPHFMQEIAVKKGLKVNNAAGDNFRAAKQGNDNVVKDTEGPNDSNKSSDKRERVGLVVQEVGSGEVKDAGSNGKSTESESKS